jgi:hypothetical protein
MATSNPMPAGAGTARHWRVVAFSTGLVVANLVVLVAGLLVVSDREHDAAVHAAATWASVGTPASSVAVRISEADVWYPITMLVLTQTFVTGAVLLVSRRSRSVGLGLVLGALVVLIGGFVWIFVGLSRGLDS